MFYHASSVKGITLIEQRTSNHSIPLIYFSEKRENVLVYLATPLKNSAKKQAFHIRGGGTNGQATALVRTAI